MHTSEKKAPGVFREVPRKSTIGESFRCTTCVSNVNSVAGHLEGVKVAQIGPARGRESSRGAGRTQISIRRMEGNCVCAGESSLNSGFYIL